jgi:4-amino-4-deoxy-L-arabinose transferase-like glycosyltransferase
MSPAAPDRSTPGGRALPRWSHAVALVALTGFSAWSAWAHRFAFFINPDSYYYLLVARNLVANHAPTGTLGGAGMPFPPQGYAAMKATYPMVVAIPIALGVDAETAGHLVSGLAAVACVPLAYLATWRLLAHRGAALAAAALVATSWGLAYWAGFVMSDSLSIALAFALIAALASTRRDDLLNFGDVGVGVLAALLVLSRPTYAVALPMLLWLGFARFEWTRARLATALVSAALPVAVISASWFPPAGFGASVLLRLAPLLLAAAALAAGAMWLLATPAGHDGARRRTRDAVYWACALAIPLAVTIGWGLQALGLGPVPSGLGNFGARDLGAVLLVIPGAWALRRSARDGDIGGALLVAAATMLGVYLWADARESRYLIHLLPLLVPVAAATATLPWRPAGPRTLRTVASTAALIALGVALAWQSARVVRGATADFLGTDYPTEVAARMGPVARPGELLVSALPWPYHFRTGLASWNSAPTTIETFTRYVPRDSTVLVMADAALHYHDEPLSLALGTLPRDHVAAEFEVPAQYRYGYVGAAFDEPMRVYRLTAAELRDLSASVATTSAPQALPPLPVR